MIQNGERSASGASLQVIFAVTPGAAADDMNIFMPETMNAESPVFSAVSGRLF